MRSRVAGRVAAVVAAVVCAVAVAIAGELSPGAHVAVGISGAVVVGLGLARRAGRTAQPVGRRARPWLAWVTAAATWEVVTLVSDDVPTVSDLADPVLGHPVLRAAAVLAWLAGGAWLVARPSRSDPP